MVEKNKIKGIIFDLGGVLVGDSGPVCIENTSKKLKVSSDRLKRVILKEELPLQRGEETSIHFWYRVCETLNIQCPSDKILSSLWKEPYKRNVKIKRDTLDLAKRLKGKYKLAILSNTISEHVAIHRKRKLFEYFDAVLLSNEVGMRKPEKEFFTLASRKLAVSSNRLLFIDNEMRWVRAARKHGLNAILFKSTDQLEKSLNRLDIDTK